MPTTTVKDEAGNTELVIVHSSGTRHRKNRVRGHAGYLRPVGKTHPRRSPRGGWQIQCKCGWSFPNPVPVRAEAANIYREHAREAKERELPVCANCNEQKAHHEMSKGSPALCKPCVTAKTRRWAADNPEAWKQHLRRSWLMKKYGLTPERFDEILASQGGVCAICRKRADDSRGFKPHVDHCHKTGKVRGILCGKCNKGIGMLCDDPEIMRNALTYLLNAESGGEDQ